MRSPVATRRAVRSGARPRPTSSRLRVTAPATGAASSQARTRRRAASALERLLAARPPDQTYRSRRAPPGAARAMKVRPTGLSGVPPAGPAMPVTATARSAPSARPGAERHGPGRLRRDRPVPGEGRLRHAEQGRLGLVAVAHDAAQEVGTGPGDLGQDVADQAAGARLGGRQGQAAGEARRLDLARKGDQRLGRRRAAGAHVWLVFCGALPRWKSHVSGAPGPPSVPMATPFIVK